MSSGNSSQRYSVTIVIDTNLKSRAKECILCCAWGFYIGGSTEPTYNVVGWSSDIHTRNTIHWTEKFQASVTNRGLVPRTFVDPVSDPVAVTPGQQFIIDDLDTVSVLPDLPPGVPKDAVSFTAKLGGCTIILDQNIDDPARKFSPAVVASGNNEKPFAAPISSYFRPAHTMIIFFALKTRGLQRRQAFVHSKQSSDLSMEPIFYNYGQQDSPFTEVALGIINNSPQLSVIQTFPSESRMMKQEPIILHLEPILLERTAEGAQGESK